jgi:outer membrane protein assembly factor BamD (BamD/ComL family)
MQSDLNNFFGKKTLVLAMTFVACLTTTNTCIAQKDTLFLNSGSTLRGIIKPSTPEQILLDDKKIDARDAKKISLAGSPRELKRAKEDLANGQYINAWGSLQKISEPPTEAMALQEYEYVKAYTMAQLALTGGQISTRDAGSAINSFVTKYPKSFRLYPILNLYGKLLVNINRVDLAEVEFQKLANSGWPEYQLKGLFDLGQAQLLMQKFPDAGANFAKIEAHEMNNAVAQQYKLLARCQRAKSNAMQGNADQAIATIEQIIKTENADNKQLFALCYNTLGNCQLQKKQTRSAAISFLHTDLLFSTEADAHAEALYHLSKIWPDLEETDRANRARQTLNSNYANSFWKSKLDAELSSGQ